MIPLLISAVLTAIGLPFFIRFMHKRQFGQEILAIGPNWHEQKSGTPTMGGTVFIVVAVVVSLLAGMWWTQTTADYKQLLTALFGLLGFAIIGFLDDGLKIFRHRNEGLTSGQKFSLQLVLSTVIALVAVLSGQVTTLNLPFNITFQSTLIIVLFTIIWLTGYSNAFNLTDGIDGLAAGNGIISLLGYYFIARAQDAQGIALFCLVLVGGLIGFLLFNRKPASIFMGDVGSLAIGGVLAIISLLLNHPLTLLFIGIVYALETASVMIQVTVFKRTGHRVFKMTPIHHHFEMSGWSEWRIDIVFWLVTLVSTIITVLWVTQ